MSFHNHLSMGVLCEKTEGFPGTGECGWTRDQIVAVVDERLDERRVTRQNAEPPPARAHWLNFPGAQIDCVLDLLPDRLIVSGYITVANGEPGGKLAHQFDKFPLSAVRQDMRNLTAAGKLPASASEITFTLLSVE